ncbi:hypothetical protein LTSESEN_4412 [Salmonella enterica subsp. enterica serovar Senftenberg str. A4-543]|uniref:Uncharacterized protein n=1 Tax=Salmonella enterica subsp. enterica serovar Senftenberg str. A4-543 TaxID=913082 RepID=G5R4C8_SALSE|nr:hypothetical protein LTSESEN_4412 [Salmonella enterica subsp. enterica serovar Senftenberg str. A4-543]
MAPQPVLCCGVYVNAISPCCGVYVNAIDNDKVRLKFCISAKLRFNRM